MQFIRIFIFILIIFSPLSFSQTEKNYYVIHKQTSTKEISKEELKNIFLGKKSFWENGQRILPITTSLETRAIKDFLLNVIGMEQFQYESYWRRLLFSGKGHPPKNFSNDEEVLDFIKKYQNAIGILSEKPKNAEELVIF